MEALYFLEIFKQKGYSKVLLAWLISTYPLSFLVKLIFNLLGRECSFLRKQLKRLVNSARCSLFLYNWNTFCWELEHIAITSNAIHIKAKLTSHVALLGITLWNAWDIVFYRNFLCLFFLNGFGSPKRGKKITWSKILCETCLSFKLNLCLLFYGLIYSF